MQAQPSALNRIHSPQASHSFQNSFAFNDFAFKAHSNHHEKMQKYKSAIATGLNLVLTSGCCYVCTHALLGFFAA